MRLIKSESNMIFTIIILVVLIMSGILLTISYLMIEIILESNKIGGWYKYWKPYLSYLSFKKYLEESNLDITKKEKCYLIYRIGIYSTYIYLISIVSIVLIIFVKGTI